MELKDVMTFNNFVVLGNTVNPDKYAYKIKHALLEKGYNAVGVYKELSSLNDVDFEIDILDLCINPNLGIKFLKENNKKIKCVVIQPGAESNEIKAFLSEHNINFMEACLLVGLKLYSKN